MSKGLVDQSSPRAKDGFGPPEDSRRWVTRRSRFERRVRPSSGCFNTATICSTGIHFPSPQTSRPPRGLGCRKFTLVLDRYSQGALGFPKAGRRRASGLSQDGQSSELFKIVLTMLSCGDESRRAREDRHHSFTSRIHRSGPSAHGIRRLKFGDQNPSIVDSGGPADRDGAFLHARKLKFQRTTSY